MQNILSKHCFSQCFYNVPLQKHGNLQCFHCSGIQKLFRPSLFARFFFHFSPISPLPEAYPSDPNFMSIHSWAQTPKNRRKITKTPPGSGLGAKSWKPPPAKADIATAILTNVIEHFVLLMPPNKHAFTAKAVWADFLRSCMPYAHGSSSPEP